MFEKFLYSRDAICKWPRVFLFADGKLTRGTNEDGRKRASCPGDGRRFRYREIVCHRVNESRREGESDENSEFLLLYYFHSKLCRNS